MDKRKDLKFLFQLALEYRLSLTVLSSILYNDIKEEHKESILNECINICKEVSPNMVNACKYLFEVETVKETPEEIKKNLDIANFYIDLYTKLLNKETFEVDEKVKEELKEKRRKILKGTDIDFKKLRLKTYENLSENVALAISKYRLKYALTRYEVSTLVYEDVKEFLDLYEDSYYDEYDPSLGSKANSSAATALCKPIRDIENRFKQTNPDIYKRIEVLNKYTSDGYEDTNEKGI